MTNMLTRVVSLAAVLAVSATMYSTANAQTTYTITTLNNLTEYTGSNYMNQAYGLNESGMIVGTSYNAYTNQNYAVTWDLNGNISEIQYNGTGFQGVARAVNNDGIVVGGSGTGSVQNPTGEAFSWQSGTTSWLGTLGGNFSEAYDINDNGTITGTAQIDPQGFAPAVYRTHAFTYENNTMTDLGTISSTEGYSRGHGINDAGEVAGRASAVNFENSEKHMATWDANGNITGYPTGIGSYSTAQQINNDGTVVGLVYDASHPVSGSFDRAAVWDSNGVLTILEGAVSEGFGFDGDFGRAWSINDDGVIVGRGFDSAAEELAFVSFDGQNMLNLNNLVDNLLNSGWSSLQNAYDVNENGQIVGYGIHNGVETAFLLTPTAVPVPAAIWLFGSALGLLGIARRRRIA